MPADFPEKDAVTAFLMARTVNLYFKHSGDWREVQNDYSAPSRKQIAEFLKDPDFMMQVEAFSVFKKAEMESVVLEIAAKGDSSSARLAAATRYLEATDPEKWDRGVRKQIVANKGSVSNSYMTANITVNHFVEALSRDPAVSVSVEFEEVGNGIQEIPEQGKPGAICISSSDDSPHDYAVTGSGGEPVSRKTERNILEWEPDGGS